MLNTYLPYFQSEEEYDAYKASYLKDIRYQSQGSILTYHQASSTTVTTYCWASRETGCDVLSLVTTTWPSPNGTMKDVRFNLLSKDIRKIPTVINAAGNKIKTDKSLISDYGSFADISKGRHYISNMLKEERNEFMKKLGHIKNHRFLLETKAAEIVQRYYRGYYVRSHLDQIRQQQTLHKQMREKLINYLKDEHEINATLGTHRQNFKFKRISSAIILQCLYRKREAKRCFVRLIKEAENRRLNVAAVKIQTQVRRRQATNRVMIMKSRRKALIKIRATIKVQARFRAFVMRKRVEKLLLLRRIRAVMIMQKWCRRYKARKEFLRRKVLRPKEILLNGVISLQKAIRCYIARRKVYRIRVQSLYNALLTSTVKIQAWMRRFLSKAYVRRLKEKKALQLKESLPIEDDYLGALPFQPVIPYDDMNETYCSDDAFKGNVFALAAKGKLEELETIFANASFPIRESSSSSVNYSSDDETQSVQSSMSKPKHDVKSFSSSIDIQHHPYETNDAGDTVLTVAAKRGQIEIVRKCLQWGFDPNHRNRASFTALHLAIKNNHLQVMQYLLSLNSVTSMTPIKQLKPISEDDGADFLIAAVENAPTTGLGALTFLLNHGINVNSVNSRNGLTAYLTAVSIGHIDSVKLILQYEPDADVRDLKRQSLLHKACKSSFELVKVFLGEEEEMDEIYGSITTNTGDDIMVHVFPEAALKLKDLDGRDCLAIAALNGQTEILEYCLEKTAGLKSSAMSPRPKNQKLSFEDYQAMFKLAESNNVRCLKYLIEDLFFDPTTIDPANGINIFMKAASCGSVDVVRYLLDNLSHRLDLSAVDYEEWNVFHHAALCNTQPMISIILNHMKAGECNITDMMLAKGNNTKDTPLHIAIDMIAEYNTKLIIKSPSDSKLGSATSWTPGKGMIDLLGQTRYRGITKALEVRNSDSYTLLHHACSLGQHEIILKLLDIGADATVFDNKGNTCLFLFLHSETSPDILHHVDQHKMVTSPLNPNYFNSPITSTHHSSIHSSRQGSTSNRTGSMSTRNRSVKFRRSSMALHADIEVIIALVKSECQLYKLTSVTPEKILALSTSDRATLDSGDVIVQEKCYELIKKLPSYLPNSADCWRLALSCLRFSNSLPAMNVTHSNLATIHDDDSVNCQTLMFLLSSMDAVNHMWSEFTAIMPMKYENLGESSVMIPVKSSFALSNEAVNKLQYAMFGGSTLIGWAVKLGNPFALSMLEKEGLSLSLPADFKGNTPLHILAQYPPTINIAATVDVLCKNNPKLMDSRNNDGLYPDMVSAKYGSMQVFKIFYKNGCKPQRALKGRYYAWVLAYVNRYKKDHEDDYYADDKFLEFLN